MPKLLTEGVSLEPRTGRQRLESWPVSRRIRNENPAVAVLDICRVNKRMQQQAYCVDRIWRFLPLIFFPASYRHGSMQRPLFPRF